MAILLWTSNKLKAIKMERPENIKQTKGNQNVETFMPLYRLKRIEMPRLLGPSNKLKAIKTARLPRA